MAIRARLKDLANERCRFGYRRLHLLLRREGVMLNHKKLFRLYREERLSVGAGAVASASSGDRGYVPEGTRSSAYGGLE
jgi:putative transposase